MSLSSTIKIFPFLLLCIHLQGQVEFQESALSLGVNHSYILGQSAGGVSFVDFTGDGLDDLTFATPKGQLPHFYRNTGNGFTRNAPLVGNTFEQKQILWADFDNDGDQDLFICSKQGPNLLYQNQGNLQMTDITKNAGLPLDSLDTFNACWADFNRDGWLDLYVCNRVPFNRPANSNQLFINNADGTFSDISSSSNSLVEGRVPFSSSALDYNNDKWPDIYIANDRDWGNVLLHNMGNARFEDYSGVTGSGIKMDGMSVTLGDFNNNGLTDIYVSNTKEGNVLLVNQVGDAVNHFLEEADKRGVSFNSTAWGSNFLDADCDGDLDLYVSGSDAGSSIQSSAFYEQIAADSFAIEPIGFEGDTVKSYANAVGDFNNNGYPDIAVVNYGGPRSFIFENLGSGNNFLKIKLTGVSSNRDGVGARIIVHSGATIQSHYTHSGIGFLGQNSHQILFGLSSIGEIDSLIVEWPSGHIDKFFNITVNKVLSITEGSSSDNEINVDEDVTILEGNFSSSNHKLKVKRLEVYPNPSPGILTISEKIDQKDYILTDAYGRMHFPKSFLSKKNLSIVDISQLPDGLYFLSILSENGPPSSIQIILQR